MILVISVKLKDMLTTFFISSIIACWAPEIQPPEPELSPREKEALENGGEFHQAETSFKQVSPSEAQEEIISQAERASSKEDSARENEQPITQKKEPEVRYPFSTITTREIALSGHGGGQIMLIPIGSNIDILEKQPSRYHIICKNCSPNRPRQAGFIEIDAL